MTCLCLTRNRREWLPKAIQCFQSQTYPNRELLILADGADVRDLLPAEQPDSQTVRLIHLEGAALIGEKRNFGCERAQGELIAHWDDDDWSAPERLADQVGRILESGKAVTGYRSMQFVHTSGARWDFESAENYSLGTSLVYRRSFWKANPFQAVKIGEDNRFIDRANALGEFVSAPGNGLMYATLHDGNTSPKIMGPRWKLVA